MDKTPVLTSGALKTLARIALGGPNCQPISDLKPFLNSRQTISLSELGDYFAGGHGPHVFLTLWASKNKVLLMYSGDITSAYCIDHIGVVRVSQKIVDQSGFDNKYFDNLRANGFQLSADNLDPYLFSHIGKIGRVVEIETRNNRNSRARVEYSFQDKKINLENVVILRGIKKGNLVAVHFAIAISRVTPIMEANIREQQMNDQWYCRLVERLPDSIDFTDWLGQDLAAWTEERLTIK